MVPVVDRRTSGSGKQDRPTNLGLPETTQLLAWSGATSSCAIGRCGGMRLFYRILDVAKRSQWLILAAVTAKK
jgi:hypothetical protein